MKRPKFGTEYRPRNAKNSKRDPPLRVEKSEKYSRQQRSSTVLRPPQDRCDDACMEGSPATDAPLTPNDILEFRSLLRDETGVEPSEQDAWNSATELVALVRMLCSRLPEDRQD